MAIVRASCPPLLVMVGIIYAYGVVLGCVGLAWNWISGGQDVPSLEWWQLVVAPLVIGGVAYVLESFGTLLSGMFGEGQSDQPRWKYAVALLVLFLVLALVILGPAFYQLSSQ